MVLLVGVTLLLGVVLLVAVLLFLVVEVPTRASPELLFTVPVAPPAPVLPAVGATRSDTALRVFTDPPAVLVVLEPTRSLGLLAALLYLSLRWYCTPPVLLLPVLLFTELNPLLSFQPLLPFQPRFPPQLLLNP